MWKYQVVHVHGRRKSSDRREGGGEGMGGKNLFTCGEICFPIVDDYLFLLNIGNRRRPQLTLETRRLLNNKNVAFLFLIDFCKSPICTSNYLLHSGKMLARNIVLSLSIFPQHLQCFK